MLKPRELKYWDSEYNHVSTGDILEYESTVNGYNTFLLTENENKELITINDPNELKHFKMYGRDSFEFRKYLHEISPDILNEITYECSECGELNKIKLPMTISFFWPDTGI